MSDYANNKSKLTVPLILLLVILGAGTFYKFVYAPNHVSLEAQNERYANNPELLASQDQLSKLNKAQIKETDLRPLLSYLPYTDGYIYVSTYKSSYNILVQYTTTLDDANTQFNNLLKRYDDSGRHYQINFRKVNKLVQYD